MKMQFITLSFTISIFFLISACQVPEPQKVYTGEKQFRTTDPSRLYFNNIRSTDYYRKRKTNTEIDLYTHRKLSYVDSRPIIQPILVNNWLENKAYIFIEKNDFKEGWSDTLTVAWSVNDSLGGYYILDNLTRPKMYVFAGQLYEALLSKQELKIKDKKGTFYPIMLEAYDRKAFMITMRDFYRLTEVF